MNLSMSNQDGKKRLRNIANKMREAWEDYLRRFSLLNDFEENVEEDSPRDRCCDLNDSAFPHHFRQGHLARVFPE